MQEELKEWIEMIPEFRGFLKDLKTTKETLQSIWSWIKKTWPGDMPEPIDIEDSFWRIDFFNELGLHSFSRRIKISHETYIEKLSDPFMVSPEERFEFHIDFNEDTGKLRGVWVENGGSKADVFLIEATLSNNFDASGKWWKANTNTRGTWKGLNFFGSGLKVDR